MRIYEEIETNQVFGAPEIERVLKCSTSTAKNVMKKLREIGVVEEVKGKGKVYFYSLSKWITHVLLGMDNPPFPCYDNKKVRRN